MRTTKFYCFMSNQTDCPFRQPADLTHDLKDMP